MARASSIARAALASATLFLAVALGVSLHTIAALLEFAPSPRSDGDAEARAAVSLAAEGSHAVGFRRWSAAEAPMPLTVWYPARHGTDTGSDIDQSADLLTATVRYAYGISPLTYRTLTSSQRGPMSTQCHRATGRPGPTRAWTPSWHSPVTP